MKHTLRKFVTRLATFLILVLGLLVVFFPYFWTFLTSIKDPAAINHPLDFSFTPTAMHWQAVIRAGIPRQALNSFLVGIITVAIALAAGAPAAYAFSRFNVGGAPTRFAVLLAEMLPPSVLIVPLFLLLYHTQVLLGTIWAAVISHLTFILPLVTWFLIGFFDEVPRDLEEQARVDGCSPWQAFVKVVVPTIVPGMAAAGLFGFVLSWNDLFYALILTTGSQRTLPVGVAGYWTFRGVEMGQMSAAILLAILPMILLSFFVQRYLLKGLGGGAITGI